MPSGDARNRRARYRAPQQERRPHDVTTGARTASRVNGGHQNATINPKPKNKRLETQMLRTSEFFPRKYMNAATLPQTKGGVAEIERVERELLGEKKQLRVVVYFAGVPEGLPLNKTNFEILVDALGAEEMDWVGRNVALRKTRVPYQGKLVDSIRVEALGRVVGAEG
jgi:hypothetical protein